MLKIKYPSMSSAPQTGSIEVNINGKWFLRKMYSVLRNVEFKLDNNNKGLLVSPRPRHQNSAPICSGLTIVLLHFSCRLRGVPFLVSYLSPTLLILVANSIAFALIMRSLLTSGNKATDNQKATGLQQARRGAAIMVLLGLTWMFGVLAIKDAKLVFQYLFCIFNSLQGLLVFVFYVVLPDGTRKMYAKFWQRNAGNPKTKREVWSSGTGIPKKADNDKYKEAYGDNIMSISSPHADTLSDNSTNVADSFRNCMVQLMEQLENGNVKEGTVPDNACKTSGTVILNGLNPGR